jgi:hypothetical protein
MIPQPKDSVNVLRDFPKQESAAHVSEEFLATKAAEV